MAERNAAVIVTKPGHATVRIGPLYPHDADSQATMFRMQLVSTSHPDGTTIEVAAFDPALPHDGPVPTDWPTLAEAIRNEPDADPEAAFPDLHSRLVAQLGYDRAHDAWMDACNAIDADAAWEERVEEQTDKVARVLATHRGEEPTDNDREVASKVLDALGLLDV